MEIIKTIIIKKIYMILQKINKKILKYNKENFTVNPSIILSQSKTHNAILSKDTACPPHAWEH